MFVKNEVRLTTTQAAVTVLVVFAWGPSYDIECVSGGLRSCYLSAKTWKGDPRLWNDSGASNNSVTSRVPTPFPAMQEHTSRTPDLTSMKETSSSMAKSLRYLGFDIDEGRMNGHNGLDPCGRPKQLLVNLWVASIAGRLAKTGNVDSHRPSLYGLVVLHRSHRSPQIFE